MKQKFIDGPACNSGQRLDNVNRAHLALASGKLVLQKTTFDLTNPSVGCLDPKFLFLFVRGHFSYSSKRQGHFLTQPRTLSVY